MFPTPRCHPPWTFPHAIMAQVKFNSQESHWEARDKPQMLVIKKPCELSRFKRALLNHQISCLPARGEGEKNPLTTFNLYMPVILLIENEKTPGPFFFSSSSSGFFLMLQWKPVSQVSVGRIWPKQLPSLNSLQKF